MKITLKDQSKSTPEIEAWLRKCEVKVQAKMDEMTEQLLMYGTVIISDGEVVPPEEYDPYLQTK